jgi:soluble lytic murein transglycosylase-like protein
MTRAHVVFVGLALLGWGILGLHVALESRPAPVVPARAETTRPTPQAYPWPPDPQWMKWVVYYCDEQGVPCWLACRLFAYESGWKPSATHYNVNSVDVGIAQLNSACLKAFEVFNDGKPIDPRDPETSIRVGVRYLAALYAETENWKVACASYNIGLAGYRSGKWPERYVRVIMNE